MQKTKYLRAAAIVLGSIIAALFLLRPLYRLPFDRVSPFRAVVADAAALVGLPQFADTATLPDARQLWYLDATAVRQMLDSLQLDDEVVWKDWWMLPTVGDGAVDATYLFIGNARRGLGWAWSPSAYGASLQFQEGKIYTFGLGTDNPLYFSRHHNLLLVGRYPFVLENALFALKGKGPTWCDDPAFRNMARAARALPPGQPQIILQPAQFDADLPAAWWESDNQRHWTDRFQWAWLQIGVQDSVAQLDGFAVAAQHALSPNAAAAAAWDFLPASLRHALPIAVATEQTANWDAQIAPWLAPGAWHVQPYDPTGSPERVSPELWVLPVADSAAFRRHLARTQSSITDRQPYQIFELLQLKDATALPGLSDRKHWQPWVVEVPGAWVASVYKDDLERYLDNILAGNTLPQSEAFAALRAQLPPDPAATHQAYLEWPPLADAETNFLHLLFPAYEWSDHGSLLLQASPGRKGIHRLAGRVHVAPVATSPVVLRWTLPLPTESAITLLPVINGAGTDGTYLWIRAANGRLWAADEEGSILWEADHCSPILPPVWFTARAGSPSFWAAATDDALVYFGAGGQQQPLILPNYAYPAAGATALAFAQPAVSDVVVPANDGHLYMFDMLGNPSQGWPVLLGDSLRTRTPVVHWQFPAEDLLSVWTKTGGWRVFGRFGDVRYQFHSVSDTIVGEPGYQPDTAQPERSRWVVATAAGKIHVTDMSGQTFALSVGAQPVDAFLFASIWGDARGDYVVQRGSNIALHGYEGNDFAQRWSCRLPVAPDTLLSAAPLGVLAIHHGQRKVWLIDGSGTIADGFPIAGEQCALLGGHPTRGYFLLTQLDNRIYRYDLMW